MQTKLRKEKHLFLAGGAKALPSTRIPKSLFAAS